MRHDLRKCLWDIEERVREIQEFACGKVFQEYANDNLLRSAIERKLEILGEIVVRIAREFPDHVTRIEGYKRFIAFWNVLAHEYDDIDDARVWDGIEASLPDPSGTSTSPSRGTRSYGSARPRRT